MVRPHGVGMVSIRSPLRKKTIQEGRNPGMKNPGGKALLALLLFYVSAEGRRRRSQWQYTADLHKGSTSPGGPRVAMRPIIAYLLLCTGPKEAIGDSQQMSRAANEHKKE
eukprot:6421611-Amphidinium_carterae.2